MDVFSRQPAVVSKTKQDEVRPSRARRGGRCWICGSDDSIVCCPGCGQSSCVSCQHAGTCRLCFLTVEPVRGRESSGGMEAVTGR